MFYPEEDSGDALLVIDEADWHGLSDNHRMASNTASFSFVTSMEGVVQDISALSTTPATYHSLFSGCGEEPRVSGRRKTMPGDDPQMDALSRVLRKKPDNIFTQLLGHEAGAFQLLQGSSCDPQRVCTRKP